MNILTKFIRDQLLNLGWDVRRTVSREQEIQARVHAQTLNQWRTIQRYAPQTVLDIGANIGQFAELCRELLPDVQIISFEPLNACFQQLENKKHALQPIEILNTALGEEDGNATIHRNDFSPSSSMLLMKDLHHEEFPQSRTSQPEEITIKRLDSIADQLPLTYPMIAKLDVQGFERHVLRGGEQTLSQATAIILEISAYSMYEGEATFDELYQLLRHWGFIYRGNVDQSLSKRDGCVLQFDALFENSAFVTTQQQNGSHL